MRINRDKKKNAPLSEETRSALDDAIINIVQAIGSKAGVLVFWDEKRQMPGRVSTYGLSDNLLEELRNLITKLVMSLYRRAVSSSDEVTALQTDVPSTIGMLNIVALPIQIDGRFVAGLCLLQPMVEVTLQEGLLDTPALPPASSLGLVPPDVEEEPPFESPYHHGIIPEQGDMVARNAHLLRRLVEEKQWLEAIIEYNADGILIVDRNCNIVGFNPAFTRLSGWTVQELRGQNCVEALKMKTAKGDACSTLCPLRLGIISNKSEEERRAEVILTTKDGEERDIELTFSIILSPNREVLGGIIGTRDITARKEAEELQNTFLSVISHELQTPIAIIKGYAGLYADDPNAPPEQLRDKMQIIYEESDRLSKLVENLLYASRIQAGGIELQLGEIDIASLIKRVAQKMHNFSAQHQLIVNLPPELPSVHADYDKIQEVLVNLIENAVKYSPKGGPIELAAEPTSNEVIISVTDNGIGVPEKERQRIFDRFSRLDSRYVRERKGAGLGLYICKAIVEAHGGRIWVEAANPKPDTTGAPTGSRFCFTLPREMPAQLPVVFGKV